MNNAYEELYKDLDDDCKTIADLYDKLSKEDQKFVTALLEALVAITKATPEQYKAICDRLGVSENPDDAILTMAKENAKKEFWATCATVAEITGGNE